MRCERERTSGAVARLASKQMRYGKTASQRKVAASAMRARHKRSPGKRY